MATILAKLIILGSARYLCCPPSPGEVQIPQNEIQALPQSDSNLGVKTYLLLLFRINRAFLSNKFPEPALHFLTIHLCLHCLPLSFSFLLAPPRKPTYTSGTTPNITFFKKSSPISMAEINLISFCVP